MPHRVEISPAAGRDLKRLPTQVQQRIGQVIIALGAEPKPQGVRKIRGAERAYRIRLGEYRVIYEVYDDEKLVIVLRVGRRTESSYRGI